MIAKHYYNGLGMSIHTTEPLDTNEQRFKYFLDGLEELEGVEIVKASRYSVDVLFGYLFEPEEVRERVLDAFQEAYRVSAREEIPRAEVFARTLPMFSEGAE